MMDELDNIIKDIDNKINETNTTLIKVTFPKQKKGELDPKQKKEIIDLYVSKNFKNITPEEISKVASIPIEKAKNFKINSNRMERTNNIMTLQLLTQYLENYNNINNNQNIL